MAYKHYVNGRTIGGTGKEITVTNPATEDVCGAFRAAERPLAEEALQSAQTAFEAWSGKTISERCMWIDRLKEALSAKRESILDILMNETGKPLGNAEYDFDMLIQCLGYYPEEAKRITGSIIQDYDHSCRNLIIHQPLGVVVGFLAWNFPLLNLGYKLGPVLASGCTCVLKPSTKTPLATLKVGEIADQIGFPAGVINLIAGEHSEIGSVLNTSTIPRMITIIGSSRAGREIVSESATSIKRYSLELGGNAPAIIMDDADIENAAFQLCDLKYGNAGQVCVNVNRVFTHARIHDAFIASVKQHSEAVKLGWGREEGAGMGPLISKKDQIRMTELVEDAVAKGARVVCGGSAPQGVKGYYFQPTVLDRVTADMRVYREEIFGPIMPVLTFDSYPQVIEMANQTEYGLAAYVFTSNYKTVFDMGEKLEFGTVCVNEPHYAVNLPHGGMKESGIGKDCSSYSLEEYYSIKRISISMK